MMVLALRTRRSLNPLRGGGVGAGHAVPIALTMRFLASQSPTWGRGGGRRRSTGWRFLLACCLNPLRGGGVGAGPGKWAA